MTEIVPIAPIGGELAPYEGFDFPVAVLGSSRTLSRVTFTLTEAPTDPGGARFDLRTATGGAGSGIAVTFAQGAAIGVGTGSIPVSAAATLWARVVTAGGAYGLGGNFELEGASAPLVGALASLAQVKAHAGIAGSTHDALLTDLLLSASDRMARLIGRPILQTAVLGELHDPVGADAVVLLRPPVDPSSVVVRVGGVTLEPAEASVDAETGLLVRLSGGVPVSLPAGRGVVSVDYASGWAVVPKALELAAVKQTRHEWAQTQPSGQDRLGKRSKALERGGALAYEDDGLLPDVASVCRLFARRF